MRPEPDYYEILGIAETATAADIKAAHRRRAKETHPDLNPNKPEAATEFKRVEEAYRLLIDPGQRLAYTMRRYAARPQAPPVEFNGWALVGPMMPRAAPSPRPAPNAPQTPSVDWGAALAALLGLSALAYATANSWDSGVDRYRGSDGTFRSGRWG